MPFGSILMLLLLETSPSPVSVLSNPAASPRPSPLLRTAAAHTVPRRVWRGGPPEDIHFCRRHCPACENPIKKNCLAAAALPGLPPAGSGREGEGRGATYVVAAAAPGEGRRWRGVAHIAAATLPQPPSARFGRGGRRAAAATPGRRRIRVLRCRVRAAAAAAAGGGRGGEKLADFRMCTLCGPPRRR
uniref:Uncharacterized protein n=1 Tax=Oryza meridionalis TaxID=40149 RepID=A0A0E0DZU5_9ORYZ